MSSFLPPELASLVFFVLSSFFLLLWMGTVVWTFQDLNLRTKNQFLFSISLLVVIFIPIAGIAFYLFVRPQTTLEDRQLADMEKLALLGEIRAQRQCPFCGESVDDDFVACPYCYKKIREVCISCKRLLELDWELCPYCATRQTATKTIKPHP